MNVIDAKIIVYGPRIGNHHELLILVDRIPELHEFRFKHKNHLYWAEKDDFVRFFYWSGEGNDGGYYGQTFKITMEDSSTVELLGPWSSRAGVMNLYFPHSIEVIATDNPSKFERTEGVATAITVQKAISIVDTFFDDWTIVRTEIDDKLGHEIVYRLRYIDDIDDHRDIDFYPETWKVINGKKRGDRK